MPKDCFAIIASNYFRHFIRQKVCLNAQIQGGGKIYIKKIRIDLQIILSLKVGERFSLFFQTESPLKCSDLMRGKISVLISEMTSEHILVRNSRKFARILKRRNSRHKLTKKNPIILINLLPVFTLQKNIDFLNVFF